MDFANQVIKVDITENNKEAKQQDDSSKEIKWHVKCMMFISGPYIPVDGEHKKHLQEKLGNDVLEIHTSIQIDNCI